MNHSCSLAHGYNIVEPIWWTQLSDNGGVVELVRPLSGLKVGGTCDPRGFYATLQLRTISTCKWGVSTHYCCIRVVGSNIVPCEFSNNLQAFHNYFLHIYLHLCDWLAAVCEHKFGVCSQWRLRVNKKKQINAEIMETNATVRKSRATTASQNQNKTKTTTTKVHNSSGVSGQWWLSQIPATWVEGKK